MFSRSNKDEAQDVDSVDSTEGEVEAPETKSNTENIEDPQIEVSDSEVVDTEQIEVEDAEGALLCGEFDAIEGVEPLREEATARNLAPDNLLAIGVDHPKQTGNKSLADVDEHKIGNNERIAVYNEDTGGSAQIVKPHQLEDLPDSFVETEKVVEKTNRDAARDEK